MNNQYIGYTFKSLYIRELFFNEVMKRKATINAVINPERREYFISLRKSLFLASFNWIFKTWNFFE
jgi:hypothetical protein